MHGQRREEYKSRLLDPTVSKGLAQKAHQWTTLTRTLLERRKTHASNPNIPDDAALEETIQLTTKALTVNPDPHHLWNLRRELLLQRYRNSISPSSNKDTDASSSHFMEGELKLTAACLERNPKAYGAWFHRKWSVRQHLQQTATLMTPSSDDHTNRLLLLDTELALCAQFLLLDERNFHCWNYRRFVVATKALTILWSHYDTSGAVAFASSLDGSWNEWMSWISTTNDNEKEGAMNQSPPIILMGPQITTHNKDGVPINATTPTSSNHKMTMTTQFKELVWAEWEFTKTKMDANFSNCSAFHYRSKLLPWVLIHSDDSDKLALAKEELELVQNAIFTEPDDQTAWWYHRFLLQWAQPNNNDADNDDNVQKEFCQLLEQEAETLRDLIETEENQCKWGFLALHAVLVLLQNHGNLASAQEGHQTEANQCLDHLIELDPDRAMRYHSMKS